MYRGRRPLAEKEGIKMHITRQKAIRIAVIALFVLAIAAVVIWWAFNRNEEEIVPEPVTAVAESEHKTEVTVVETEKLVTVEKTITGEMIQDGLQDMGFLITQEYFFTEVMSYSGAKEVNAFGFEVEIPLTESAYVVSYDGKVTAGVDFSGILVDMDDEQRKITITVPKAEIYATDIDFDSFTLYSEKNGIGNRISVSDYNASLSELKKNAQSKAEERDLIEQAEKNAENIIRVFTGSLVDTTLYDVRIKTSAT